MDEGLQDEFNRINDAVECFALAMKAKMQRKAIDGWRGWDDAAFEPTIEAMLSEHVSRNVNGSQSVDIANLAMMLWNFDRVRE